MFPARSGAVFALLLVLATPVAADPVAKLHWDTCDSAALTKSYAGPGTYTQVVTLSGIGETVKGVEVLIQLMFRGANGCAVAAPDAWRFDAGGCQAGRVAASYAAAPGDCPVLGSTGRASLLGATDATAPVIHVVSAFDPVTLSADSTYTVVTLAFDQSQSVVGASHDGLCGGVDLPGCAQIVGLSYLRPDNSVVNVGGAWSVAWQSADGCSFCDPAKPATWGRVKAEYR